MSIFDNSDPDNDLAVIALKQFEPTIISFGNQMNQMASLLDDPIDREKFVCGIANVFMSAAVLTMDLQHPERDNAGLLTQAFLESFSDAREKAEGRS